LSRKVALRASPRGATLSQRGPWDRFSAMRLPHSTRCAAGAKYVIATEEEDLLKEIDKITGGQGARVVFDPVGGPTPSKLIKAMSFQGLLYLMTR
jgi:threonine dehydrogenase-like Zn-dependent dehydrogenase